ncbi:MAG: ligase-associated DNA damage response endonuclease PdeM [Celeribacter sp.]
MNGHAFTLCGAALVARPTGALWWSQHRLLCVSDLHLGKSERMARRGGGLLPPYETRDTLDRLSRDIDAMNPDVVVCLGDSFDDLTAAAQVEAEALPHLSRMMAGRRWIWIEGNHDPGPVAMGGEHHAEFRLGKVTFRHIAQVGLATDEAEISGHYHPKHRISGPARPCFLIDGCRTVMPAYGTYTGGLSAQAAPLADLFGKDGIAVLTGTSRAIAVPLRRPRTAPRRQAGWR